MYLVLEEFNDKTSQFDERLQLSNPQVSVDVEFMPAGTRLIWNVFSFGKPIIKLIHNNHFNREDETMVYGTLILPEPIHSTYARIIIRSKK